MKSAISLAAVLLLASCARKDTSSALHVGDLLVQLRLDPDPPVAGDNVVHLELMDAQRKPIDGARLEFIADMPAMGAMPEMKGGGDVKTMGAGRYDVAYSLSMLGDWNLTLGIDAPGHAHAELRLKVSPPRKGYTVETRGATAAREGAPKTLELSPERQQLIGVVYAKVERRPLSLTLRMLKKERPHEAAHLAARLRLAHLDLVVDKRPDGVAYGLAVGLQCIRLGHAIGRELLAQVRELSLELLCLSALSLCQLGRHQEHEKEGVLCHDVDSKRSIGERMDGRVFLARSRQHHDLLEGRGGVDDAVPVIVDELRSSHGGLLFDFPCKEVTVCRIEFPKLRFRNVRLKKLLKAGRAHLDV